MLKEYVTQITNKDKMFEKMNAQIEQLTNRLKILENFKKLNSKKINLNPITTNSSNKIENRTTYYTNTHMNSLTNTNSNNNTYESKNNPTQGSISMKKTETKNSNNTNTNKSFSYIPNKITQKNNLGINKGKDKINNNNTNNNNKNNNNIINEFLLKQATLIEEMSSIKDDIQFILENQTRSKMKEKLNQSIYSSNNNLNNSFISNNSSVIHNNNNNISYISGNSSLNNSIISASSSSINSSHRNSNFYGRKKFNIKDRFCIDDNFTDFLSSYNQYKNILFLIDNNDNVWELVKRIDLNINTISNYNSNVKSVIFCEKLNDKLNNIEIKEPFENKSLLESEEELTPNNHKYSEFNLSKYIKESE